MSTTTEHPPAAEPQTPGEEAGGRRIEGRSPWRLAWERLRRDRVAMGSAVIIALMGLLAVFAGVISDAIGHPPDAQYRDIGLSPAGIPQPPSAEFWFGTDGLGRDVFVRVLYGARISLFIGVVSSGIATTAGVVVGLTAGYFGGVVDNVLARGLDVVLSMPYLLFAVALAAVFSPSLRIVIGVIAFFTFAAVGRIVRGQTLSAKEREYVEAARSLGASDRRIMVTEILPNIIAPVIVYASLLIPIAILFAASLSFLGVGVPPGTAAWGNMLNGARDYYTVAPWLFAFPGGALLLTTLAFNLLGDGIRDALDPKSERLLRRG